MKISKTHFEQVPVAVVKKKILALPRVQPDTGERSGVNDPAPKKTGRPLTRFHGRNL
jgi:hypothetical protein